MTSVAKPFTRFVCDTDASVDMSRIDVTLLLSCLIQ